MKNKTPKYYYKIYKKFIISRKNLIRSGYIEIHHIKPRCFGGTNKPNNLIALTPREHFFAHLLLYKAFPTNKKIISALSAMAYGGKKNLNSWQYNTIKEAITKPIPTQTVLKFLYFEQNLSYAKIAKIYKVSDMTVCKWFKHYDILPKPPNHLKLKSPNKQTLIKIFLKNKKNIVPTSKEFGVSVSTIYKWLKENHIPMIQVIGKTKQIPHREELENLYLNKNLSLKSLHEHYKVTKNLVRKWLKIFNIVKRKHS